MLAEVSGTSFQPLGYARRGQWYTEQVACSCVFRSVAVHMFSAVTLINRTRAIQGCVPMLTLGWVLKLELYSPNILRLGVTQLVVASVVD